MPRTAPSLVRRKKPRHALLPSLDDDERIPPIVERWLVRLAWRDPALRGNPIAVLEESYFRQIPCLQELLNGCQDTHENVPETGKPMPSTARQLALVDYLFTQALQRLAGARLPPVLAGNVARLAQTLSLTAAEQAVLAFAAALSAYAPLHNVASSFAYTSPHWLARTLADVLETPLPDMQAALSREGTLQRCGLLAAPPSGRHVSLDDCLELPSPHIATRLCTTPTAPADLLQSVLTPAPPATLALHDYGHMPAVTGMLLPYLRHALDTRRRGVNIFIHGAPGSGKTQLTRVLAQALGCQVLDVAAQDEDGVQMGSERRLRALAAGQHFFASQPTLLVMDEAEDVFNTDDLAALFIGQGSRRTAGRHKAWMHQLLENNAAPTLWLSNTASGLDPATVRRFDLFLEMAQPSHAQRLRTLQAQCAHLPFTPDLDRLASQPALTPAVVARAVSVVQAIADSLPASGQAATLEQLIDNTLTAQGHATLGQCAAHALPPHYDPALVNASADLDAVARGLHRHRAARLCLYGPAGTGKTAWARWLAQHLGAPLHVRRVSDLLSKWVGESEKNIALAFRQAAAENAVLLIDEVDSFLHDRHGAQARWEISQVNEMLTQMESYAGIFIASTNLMQALDPAVLRRFDLKLCFDYLHAPQAVQLLHRHCQSLGLPAPTAQDTAAVARLRQLTPGDFATVARRHAFAPLASAAQWVRALGEECALKASNARPIGFY